MPIRLVPSKNLTLMTAPSMSIVLATISKLAGAGNAVSFVGLAIWAFGMTSESENWFGNHHAPATAISYCVPAVAVKAKSSKDDGFTGTTVTKFETLLPI